MRKKALSKYFNIVNLITATTSKADTSYTNDKSTHKIKYTILKHAPMKFGKVSIDTSDKSSADAQSER